MAGGLLKNTCLKHLKPTEDSFSKIILKKKS